METKVKCIYCGNPIHISKFGGIKKEGLFCNDILCITKLLREEESRLDALSENYESQQDKTSMPKTVVSSQPADTNQSINSESEK